MVSEIPIFKFQVWHLSHMRALKNDIVREEWILERALALVKVLGHFRVPFSRGDIDEKFCCRARRLSILLHAFILLLHDAKIL